MKKASNVQIVGNALFCKLSRHFFTFLQCVEQICALPQGQLSNSYALLSCPNFTGDFFSRLNILNSYNHHVTYFAFLQYSHCPPLNAFTFMWHPKRIKYFKPGYSKAGYHVHSRNCSSNNSFKITLITTWHYRFSLLFVGEIIKK